MTDLNDYLRRADVEALIDGKIESLDEDIARADAGIAALGSDDAKSSSIRADKHLAEARKGALSTVRSQLRMCQQFRHRTFVDGGARTHALVDAAKDRVPMEPVA